MPIPTPQRTRKRVLKRHERRAPLLLAGCGAADRKSGHAVAWLHGRASHRARRSVRTSAAQQAVSQRLAAWRMPSCRAELP
jgi:hypothetical protein